MTVADDLQRERAALRATVSDAGFDLPTACGEWSAGDIAVHVVVGDLIAGLPTTMFRALVGRGVRVDRMASANRAATRGWRRRRDPAWALDRLARPAPWVHRRGRVGAVSLLEVWAHHEDVLAATGARCSTSIDLTPVVAVLLRYQRRALERAGIRVVTDQLIGGVGPTTVQGSLEDVARWLAGRAALDTLTVSGPYPPHVDLVI